MQNMDVLAQHVQAHKEECFILVGVAQGTSQWIQESRFVEQGTMRAVFRIVAVKGASRANYQNVVLI